MVRTTRTNIFSIAVLTLAAAAGVVIAGPIDPPPGPVATTFKTLTETEPRKAINAVNTPGNNLSLYRITQPGSYYLTGNITGVAGKHGIEITCNNVSLDLMGFTMQGVPGSLDAITKDEPIRHRLRVVNGIVSEWGGDGVDLANVGIGDQATIEHVDVHGCGGKGINAPQSSIIRACTVRDCSSIGIYAGGSSVISQCIAESNSATGIAAGSSCRITDCVAFFNSVGIQVSSGSLVRDCTSSNNIGDGLIVQSGCVASGNLCGVNGLRGIHGLGPDNVIEGNTLSANATGIDADAANCVIVRNFVISNTVASAIVAGNTTGPWVTSGTIAASTNPHANYLP